MELDSLAEDGRKEIGHGYGGGRSQPGEEREGRVKSRKAVSRQEPSEIEGYGPKSVQQNHEGCGRQQIAAVHGLRNAGDGCQEGRRGYLLRRRPEQEEEQGGGELPRRMKALHCLHRSHRLWNSRKRKKNAMPAADTAPLRSEANRGARAPS
ncbi:hypothetical protein SDC9_163565 [bioreactor metagenome]|uniref:Uncharacterized protein n=1 Tax=bioreactor metagenome TaxID=1076179 RepID=A0A645FP72_9ZZZZ